jgi:hypothetical protein
MNFLLIPSDKAAKAKAILADLGLAGQFLYNRAAKQTKIRVVVSVPDLKQFATWFREEK